MGEDKSYDYKRKSDAILVEMHEAIVGNYQKEGILPTLKKIQTWIDSTQELLKIHENDIKILKDDRSSMQATMKTLSWVIAVILIPSTIAIAARFL